MARADQQWHNQQIGRCHQLRWAFWNHASLAGLAHTSFQGFQECNSQTSPWQRTKSKRQAQLDYTSSQALPSLNSKSSTKVKICTP
eukprot:scaffold116689_cov20-Tisochrysis_lutea.AAC.2